MRLRREAMSGNYTKAHSLKARTVPNGPERPREAVSTSSPGEEEEARRVLSVTPHIRRRWVALGGLIFEGWKHPKISCLQRFCCFLNHRQLAQPALSPRANWPAEEPCLALLSSCSCNRGPAGSLSLPNCARQGRGKEGRSSLLPFRGVLLPYRERGGGGSWVGGGSWSCWSAKKQRKQPLKDSDKYMLAVVW